MNKGSPVMLRLRHTPHDRRAKDGSLSAAVRLASMGGLVGRRVAWSEPVAIVPADHGDPLRTWATDRYQLAPRGGNPRRFRRLLLLPSATGTQGRRVCSAIVDAVAAEAGDRRPRAVRC